MFFLLFSLLINSCLGLNDTHFHNSNGTKHSDLFLQDVNMVFYEDLNQCLNNGEYLLKSTSDYNINCNCLNSSECLNKLFNSDDFESKSWYLNNQTINGSQCQFKTNRICDLCGGYPVRTRINLFGQACYNKYIITFLLTLFIICCSFAFALCCVYSANYFFENSNGTYRRGRFGRRSGYTKIVNDIEKGRPPSYN